jgi:glycosyltransferase involved in cell wall biosynthesis
MTSGPAQPSGDSKGVAGVSVVIPTKDRLAILRETLPLFQRQAEVAEIVVVVDGSRDGTVEYLEDVSASDARVRYLDNGVNRGLPYSRNAGIEKALGEYIFTAEDDLIIPERFFKVLLAHLAESDADIIAAREIFRFDDESADAALQRVRAVRGAPVNLRNLEAAWHSQVDDDIEQPMLPAPMLARAEVFRAIKFDEKYAGNWWREETDFQISALETGYKLVFCPHVVMFNVMRRNDRSGSHASAGLTRLRWTIVNNWRFLRKHRLTIRSRFQIGNRYLYIVKFSLKRFMLEIIVPFAVRAKRRFAGEP